MVKHKVDRTIEKFKARLIAKGLTQNELYECCYFVQPTWTRTCSILMRKMHSSMRFKGRVYMIFLLDLLMKRHKECV